MTAIESLADFISRPGIAKSHKDLLTRHVADIIGAFIAGSAIPEGRAIALFFQGGTLFDRMAANVAIARCSEIDDIHLPSLTTPGAIVVISALTLASERNDISGDDLADAIAGGYEALIRFGLAIGGASTSDGSGRSAGAKNDAASARTDRCGRGSGT